MDFTSNILNLLFLSKGEEILKLLKKSLVQRNIQIEIVTDAKYYNMSRRNLEELRDVGK